MEFVYGQLCCGVTVQRRRGMKRVHFRAHEDGRLHVTCPYGTSDAELRSLMDSHAPAIAAMLHRMQEAQAARPDYTDGSQLTYPGGTLTLRWSAVPCPTVQADDVLTLFARTPQEAELAAARWLRTLCSALYGQINREVCGHFRAQGYDVPLARVEIRDMRSRWGSCTPASGRISINYRLMHYPEGCLRGVFYHEYTHFMELNHSAAFYQILRRMYPDYDKWDKLLRSASP